MRSYELIRSRRRTLSLEITPQGNLKVRAPQRLSRAQIDGFVASREGWIARQLDRMARRPALPEPTAQEAAALRTAAQADLPRRVERWSAVMGLYPAAVTITAAKRRYGSCSAHGRICFSYRLMRCPEAAIDLVVVHELCHLRHLNHGREFYALLAHYLPDWQDRRTLLR